jgi:hypothetical protein
MVDLLSWRRRWLLPRLRQINGFWNLYQFPVCESRCP